MISKCLRAGPPFSNKQLMELSVSEYFELSLHTLLYSLTVFQSLDLKNKQTRNKVNKARKK